MRFWKHFASQNGPQIDANIDQKISDFLISFWLRFSCQNNTKMDPKSFPKSIKNQSKYRFEFHGCFKQRPTIYSKIFEWIEGHGFRGPSKIPPKTYSTREREAPFMTSLCVYPRLYACLGGGGGGCGGGCGDSGNPSKSHSSESGSESYRILANPS